MPNKSLMLGVAFAVAGLVLLMTVFIGGPGVRPDDAPTDIENPDVFVIPDPNDSELQPQGEAEGIVYEIKEQGILFFADRIVPRTEGEIDAINTNIRIHFAPGRELTIDADEGTIVAPDQHPQEGQMRGNVVVTLYETPDGSPVDFDTDRDIVIRMYFDEPVDFDLELQQIDSTGPIFLTGPQVQFRGRGLSMNYNQRRQRIQRLVIEQGESLHYIPEPVRDTTAEPARPVAASKQKNTAGQQSTNASSSVEGSETASAEPVETESPIQHYLATFEELNDVRVGLDQYIVRGDTLSTIFSTKSAEELDETVPSSALPRRYTPVRSSMLASADPFSAAIVYALAASMGQTPNDDPRSLATFTEEDVVITWEGRLVVTPLEAEDVPDALAATDDVMVTVIGKPAEIITDQAERFSAPKISFFSKSAGVLAKSNDSIPVLVEASDLGSLSIAELLIDQSAGKGRALGPGTLTAQIKDQEDDTKTHPLTVTFDDRLDLAFYLEDQPEASTDNAINVAKGRIKGIKTAEFIGGVEVDYHELDMTADRLTLAMVEDAPEDDDKLAVESLTAAGSVEALVISEDVTLKADRLLARPATDQLELFGNDVADAQVIHPDATLTGKHMVMDDKAGTVDVPGPGTFTFQPDPEDTGKTVRVTWAERMHYDDKAGVARFVGEVYTLAVDGTDTNELMGDELVLTFVEDTSADSADSDPGDPTTGRRLATAVMDGKVRYRARSYLTDLHKQLQTELYLTESDKMIFTDPGEVALSGDKDAVQKVDVLGAGRMLITDTRPEEQTTSTASTVGGAPVDFSGQGLTAFQWSDSLRLDLTNGVMLMKGRVAMVHQPEDGDLVRLDCHDLAAEIKPAESTKQAREQQGGWLSKDAPQPELQRVWADGNIMIRTADITVTCDHLLYEEAKREILLWSDEPNVVVYEVEGEPTPARSSAFKWNRDTGLVEALNLRSGMIPLRRGEKEEN